MARNEKGLKLIEANETKERKEKVMWLREWREIKEWNEQGLKQRKSERLRREMRKD